MRHKAEEQNSVNLPEKNQYILADRYHSGDSECDEKEHPFLTYAK